MSPFGPQQRRGDGPSTSNQAGGSRISRRAILLRGVGAAALSAVITAVHAAAFAPERLVTTSYSLTPPGWNAGPLRVAAIADVHAGGPNMDATPNDIIARIEAYSGVRVAEAFALPTLDREIKWHCKYARQNGIHVSPTFMVDGLVQPDMGSGDAVSAWVSRLVGA